MTLDQNVSLDERLSQLEALLPSSRANLRRLSVLLSSSEQPKVAVFGKYNHGKSTLLNALIGQEIFKVADKRETLSVSEFIHDDVTWIDTPGLDADVSGEDDRRAMKAALESADILCLIHNVKAGELDRSEMQLYQQLMRQDSNYRSKLVLVLTQIDQVTPEDLEQVVSEIRSQLPDLQISKVSALRYTRGIHEDKNGFIKASGILEFLSYLNTLKGDVVELRQKEAQRLIRKARVELTELINDRKNSLRSATSNMEKYKKGFWFDVENARNKIVDRAVKLDLM
ncbi:GTPase [Vreelandella neptunia]|uniref:GTPase Era n=1 Tax=Vreelandella neptunia TaxID=115551 RepID=A0ABZ0YI46_9GAMM|nr:GTPase [Halomonas neptunia]MDN3562084.1 50S ribosome-binding GTPase [Halomonas neptunia]WQH11787.1 GTPase [Halomonas neptunia]